MLPHFEKVEANLNHSFHINHMKVDYSSKKNVIMTGYLFWIVALVVR